jgi:hypothetical protein
MGPAWQRREGAKFGHAAGTVRGRWAALCRHTNQNGMPIFTRPCAPSSVAPPSAEPRVPQAARAARIMASSVSFLNRVAASLAR